MAFSNQAMQALQSLAGSLGLPLVPASDGSFSFVFQRSGTLTLTSASDGERTLVSLSARRDGPVEMDAEQLMRLAGPDVTTDRFLSAGIARDGTVTFAVSIDDEEISLPVLETCMQQLFAARSAIG